MPFLIFSSSHRDLVAELPFILMHPKPDDLDENNLIIDQSTSNNESKASTQNKGASEKGLISGELTVKDDVPNLIQLDG
jgi:hypothetical protein